MNRDGRGRPVVADGGQRPAEDEVFCTDCGSIIKAQAEICPECGVRQLPESDQDEGGAPDQVRPEEISGGEDPVVAAALSFFLPGLGQFYNGDVGRGVALLGLAVFSIILMFVLVGFLTYPVVWAYAIYDAYVNAD